MLTLPIGLFLALAFTHWVADFLLQSDAMALNKSHDTPDGFYYLTLHVMVYTACFFWTFNPQFLLFTALFHWLTDFCTSRVNAHLWFFKEFLDWNAMDEHVEGAFIPTKLYYAVPGSNRHWFFVSIGFDQFLHTFALVAGAAAFL